jgi:putative spermidine/putrescine transport system permease protein
VVPALLVLVVVYGYPAINLIAQSLDAPLWSLQHYRETFEPPFWTLVIRTFVISAEVTGFCVLLGYPLAYAMLTASARWRRIIVLAVMLPLWTSTLVRCLAWMIILGQAGVVNQLLQGAGLIEQPLELLYTRFAVLIGFVHVMLPFFVFPLYGVLTRLDLQLVDAARSMGASRPRAFLSVFLPLSLPGVASGTILIFILCLGYLVTPALLGGLSDTTYVMMIAREVTVALNWNLAAAMSLVLLVLTIIPVLMFGRLVGFSLGSNANPATGISGWLGRFAVWLATRFVRSAPRATPGSGSTPRARRRASGGLGPRLSVYVGIMLVFLFFPLLLLVPLSLGAASYLEFPPSHLSLRWFESYLSRGDWLESTWTSLQIAASTSAFATLLGTSAAVGLSRAKSRWVGVAFAFLMSPLVVPHMVIAVGLYFELVRLKLSGTMTGLFLAHLVIALPVVVIIVLGALRSTDLMPERAARSLGAPPLLAFCKTTLVALHPSIVSAALFAFLASFDDVVMALFLSGVNVTTLPKRMWDSIVLEIDPSVAAVSVSLMVFSIALFTASSCSAVAAGTLHSAKATRSRARPG